jgi:hypothetical protein
LLSPAPNSAFSESNWKANSAYPVLVGVLAASLLIIIAVVGNRFVHRSSRSE